MEDRDGKRTAASPWNRRTAGFAIHFAPVPIEASLEVFEKILPDMLKELKDAAVIDKAKEHTEDGLTGIHRHLCREDRRQGAMCIFVLFKGEKEQSVLGTIFVASPRRSPRKTQAFGAFMKSMKARK